MNSPTATVLAVEPAGLTLQVESAATCSRCAAGRGCGAGLLAAAAKTQQIRVPVADGMSLRPGDNVVLTLRPGALLRAAFIGYGMPLLGALLALLPGPWLVHGPGDAGAALLAAAGLGAGVLAGRGLLRHRYFACDLGLSVAARLPDTTPGAATRVS
ncbi:MAG: hypothetical protein BMS9Abin32_422 [Gammaproteobacteria bacterium]|nr:MAG: hypothetical protein BMS9Abin32_422 [Gammaproteobacteria bacterium]